MLRKLLIKNFALISESEIRFDAGLTVITGETGAGKSIMLNALGLILGNRADLHVIGNPQEKCLVEAELQIEDRFKSLFEENDLDFENLCIIRRELSPNGKSRAFINDTPTSNKVLKELVLQLVDIHGQRDNQQLFDPLQRLQLLDKFGGHQKELKSYQDQYHSWKKLKQKIASVEQNLRQGKQELDFKNFQLNELLQAKLLGNEEFAELENQSKFYESFEEIQTLCKQVLSLSEEPINLTQTLHAIIKKSESFEVGLGKVGAMGEQATAIHELFRELEGNAAQILEESDFSPEEVDRINTRLDLLNNLMNKHGVQQVSELLEIQEKLEEEVSGLAFSDEQIQELKENLIQEELALSTAAERLNKVRTKTAKELCGAMEQYLPEMNMVDARLEFRFEPESEYQEHGAFEVDIWAQMNAGTAFIELQKTASGGELSRIMLALKTVLSEKLQLPTLIFDEIDTGLGGETASKMGGLLKILSNNCQVISITHLAQIAAKGQHHFKVVKQKVGGKTVTSIDPVNQDHRLDEIARMISGEHISPEALANAKVLLN